MGSGQRPGCRSSIQDLCCPGAPIRQASTFSSGNCAGPRRTLCALLGRFCHFRPDLQELDKSPPVGCSCSPPIYMDSDLCLVLDKGTLNMDRRTQYLSITAAFVGFVGSSSSLIGEPA